MALKKGCDHRRHHWSDLWQHPKTKEPYAPCNAGWLCRIQLGPHYRLPKVDHCRDLHLSLCADPEGVTYVIDEGLALQGRRKDGLA